MHDLAHVRFEGRPALAPRRAQPTDLLSRGLGSPLVTSASRSTEMVPADGLAAAILRAAALDARCYRPGPLERRIAACLRHFRAETEALATSRLSRAEAGADAALSTLLIGVTSFFRDSSVFEALHDTVIPALAARKTLRVWSLGCSTGAELYSVAMLLADAGLLDRVSLLGVDCRRDVIAAAQSGVFDTEAIAGLDLARRARYFIRSGGKWRIDPALQRRTTWHVMDVTATLPEGDCDLALCRNLVIYLQKAAGDQLLSRVAARLSSGGYLVVGKAERPSVDASLVQVSRCVYRGHVA